MTDDEWQRQHEARKADRADRELQMLADRLAFDKRRHTTPAGELRLWARTIIAGLLIVTLMIGGVELDNNRTERQIQTDRIAACAASDDVVGCLEALS